MYHWAHSESPALSTQVPGKLPPVAWPPTKESIPNRPGAKYTEAGKFSLNGLNCLTQLTQSLRGK